MAGTEKTRRDARKQYWQRLLIPAFLILLAVSAGGADKSKDEETLKNAAKVLSEMLSSNSVPAEVLAGADCVIVLPSVKKFGFGIGGSGGRGPMSCRGGKDFNGKWSAPAMYSMGGASMGFQVGGSSTDFVLLFLSENMSPEIARDALGTGALGYVVKSDAAGELLLAVNEVLLGKRFISARLENPGL